MKNKSLITMSLLVCLFGLVGCNTTSSTSSTSGSPSIISPTSAKHTHTWSTNLEIETKASEYTLGKKAYKCTLCGEFDTSREVEYTPYMNSYNWDEGFIINTNNYTIVCKQYISDDPDYVKISTQTRYNDKIKLEVKKYDSTGTTLTGTTYKYVYKDSSLPNPYYEIDIDKDGDKAGGELDKAEYDFYANTELDKELKYESVFNETEGCYDVTQGGNTNPTVKLYFNMGKLVKRVETPQDDGEYINYDVTFTSEDFTIPTIE